MEVARLQQKFVDLTNCLFQEVCSMMQGLIHVTVVQRGGTGKVSIMLQRSESLKLVISQSNSRVIMGFLDDQFTQLQMLQDASNPDFVAEVITLFSEDSERLLTELTKSLEQEPVDYKKVDAYVHQFKGSSSSVGAQRVKAVCMDFRAYAEARNREGCLQALQQIKQEFYLVKSKLEALLQLEKQIVAAGGAVPMME